MTFYALLMAAAEDLSFTETVTPYIPIVTVAIGAIATGIWASHNRRRGAVETRAPDVNEVWIRQNYSERELDRERRWRRALEDYVNDMVNAYRALVGRFIAMHGPNGLTDFEKKMFETKPPEAPPITVDKS